MSKTSSDNAVLSAYLKRSVPAQWVSWWSELPECEEKARFAAIIFENDQLRSLTSKDIRSTVLEFIEASHLMRARVFAEAQETLEKIVEAATAIRAKKPR